MFKNIFTSGQIENQSFKYKKAGYCGIMNDTSGCWQFGDNGKSVFS